MPIQYTKAKNAASNFYGVTSHIPWGSIFWRKVEASLTYWSWSICSYWGEKALEDEVNQSTEDPEALEPIVGKSGPED